MQNDPLNMASGFAKNLSTATDSLEAKATAPAAGVEAVAAPAEPALLRGASGAWVQMDGLAHDVAFSTDGTLYSVGTSNRDGGSATYERKAGADRWSEMGIGGRRIAAAPGGTPWVVDIYMRIWRREAAGWVRIQGESQDIGIGADGTPWVIGPDQRAGGFGVHRFVSPEAGWARIDGCAGVRVAVDRQGNAWVATSTGNLFVYDGKGYSQHTQAGGFVVDIGLGADGTVALACADGTVRVSSPKSGGWTRLQQSLTSVAVSPQGEVVGTDATGRIWRYVSDAAGLASS